MMDVLSNLGIDMKDAHAILGDLECVDPSQDFATGVLNTCLAFAASCGCSIPPNVQQQIRMACISEHESWERVYGAVSVGLQARQNQRPNRLVGLFGPEEDVDHEYPGNTIIPLTPRIANVVQSDLVFNGQMSFWQMLCDETDIANGWKFVGGTTKFSSEVVAAMQQDTQFNAFSVHVPPDQSPLATYQYKHPPAQSVVTFTCAAMHNNTDPTILHGATLLIQDRSCRTDSNLFEDSANELAFGGMVQLAMQQYRNQCRRYRMRAPNGNAGPFPPPALPPAR